MSSGSLQGEKYKLRIIRPFISSTFIDMQDERDILIKKIFPQLRKFCQERSATFTEVDLRWGITTEQVEERKLLGLCFEEISRSRPYFIGLLGERYGFVPDTDIIPFDLLESQHWLNQCLNASVTELEIRHGFLNEPLANGYVYFYFRDPAYLETLPEETNIKLKETNAEASAKLEKLKTVIRDASAKNLCVLRENYKTPEQLGEWLLNDFSEVIEKIYPLLQVPDQLQQEAINHEIYAERLRFGFVGRDILLSSLNAYGLGIGKTVVLTGEPGCGKSAILAEWVSRWRIDHPDDLIIEHYVGGTQQSNDWEALVLRIVGELKGISSIIEERKELKYALNECIDNIKSTSHVVLILDGLDLLFDDGYALQLEWFPDIFPENFTVFISCGDSEPLKVLRHRGCRIIEVPIFTHEEVVDVVSGFFAQYGNRRLPNGVISKLATTDTVLNPLFLRTVLNELRQFGNHSELYNTAIEYISAASLPQLFCRIISRWQQDFENQPECCDMVRRTLCLIACSRLGLSESELMELLGNDAGPLPRRHWAPLFLAAESALTVSSGLLTIRHRYLREAISMIWGVVSPHQVSSRQWAAQMSSSTEFHEQLAVHFEKQPMSARKVKELPWQYQENHEWQAFFDLLDSWPLDPLLSVDKTDLQFHWQRAELEIRQINNRFSNMGSLFQMLLATCLVHRTMELMGKRKYRVALVVIDEAIAILEHPRDAIFHTEDMRSKLAMALSIKTGLCVSTHDFEQADALIAKQQQIGEDLGDNIILGVAQRLRESVAVDKKAHEQQLRNSNEKHL